MLKVDGKIVDKKEILKDKTWKPYKQVFVVYAREMSEDFELDTPTGVVEGHKGDMLIMGIRGNKWVVPAEIFKKTYESL